MRTLERPHKKLWRSRRNRRIAGVCGGLGDYFNVDPLVIRIIFVLFLLLGGSAMLVYLLLWILVPLEPFEGRNVY